MKTTANELRPMTVYKASAGSGKTFTLAAQYISIVLYDAWKHNNYKSFEHIVAMTFTVKATKEMKDRILSYLHDLATGRQDPSFTGFKTKLAELLRLKDSTTDILAPDTQERLQTCAREILRAILRNYARFNITTIDSFFQSVLQGVLYELGLPAEQQLLLDETDIHNRSVDRMIDSLHDDEASRAVLKPILDFAKDSLSDNKSVWDIRKELKSEAAKLGQEVYKFHAEAIEEESRGGRYDALRKSLYAKKIRITKHIEDSCNRFLQRVSAHPLGGKQPLSVLATAAKNMRELKWKWESPAQGVQKVLDGEIDGEVLYDEFIDLYNTYLHCTTLLNTIQVVLPNLYTITLLANIEGNMRDIQKENMQMLLSNANLFLRDLLAGDARDFVYSKVGPKLEHLLIDEFQDTSQMQWNNLQPLVSELQASGKHNVIVGDVKQSIYRFRNGKWQLLADIANQRGFVSLGDNFRSTRAVVETNNSLFPLLAQEMDRILDANGYGKDYLSPVYEKNVEVHQNVNKEGGNVRFFIYPLNTKKQDNEKTEADERLRKDFCLQFRIIRQRIAEKNESASIAILVRKKKEGDTVLDWLQQDEELRTLSVETEDSFQLASSPAVQLLTAILRYLAVNDKETRLHSIDRQYIEDRLGQKRLDELENSRTHWLSHPLYEMNDRLIRHFGLTRMNEDEFIEKYLSCLKAFLTSGISTPAGLKAFLDYWDETMSEVKVNKSPEKDSVTLMTIHKSKGLAFDYVLVPLFNSTMNKETRNDTLLWDTEEIGGDADDEGIRHDLQSVSVLSVTSQRSRTSQSLWAAPYSEEVRLRFMDALNTVYVAFTRPKQAYYCWCAYSIDPKTTDTDSIGTPLLKALGQTQGLVREDLDGDVVVFTSERPMPEQTAKADKTPHTDRLDITKNAAPNPIPTPMFPDTDTLPLEIVNSNRALQLFSDIQADTGGIREQQSFIDEGLIYHALFENLATLSDEDTRKAIDLYRLTHEMDGRHEQTFRQFVQQARDNAVLREAFSPDAQTLTEAAFIVAGDDGAETLRPDRVALLDGRAIVIDYKFSSYRHLLLNDERHALQRRQYRDQINGYISLIQRFYHLPAEGWFWFLRDNEVINVNNLNN